MIKIMSSLPVLYNAESMIRRTNLNLCIRYCRRVPVRTYLYRTIPDSDNVPTTGTHYRYSTSWQLGVRTWYVYQVPVPSITVRVLYRYRDGIDTDGLLFFWRATSKTPSTLLENLVSSQ